jgi:hypothetical protein
MAQYEALKVVAKELKLSPDTLRRWCAKGFVTYSKLPGTVNALWLIDRESLERFLKQHEHEATEDVAEQGEKIEPNRLPGRPPRFKAVR